jgi:hypothetical protein
VEGQDHRQLEKHSIVDLDRGKEKEAEKVEMRGGDRRVERGG